MKTKIKISTGILTIAIIGIQIWSVPFAMASITEKINGVVQTYDPTPDDQTWCQQQFSSSCEKAYSDSKVSIDGIKNHPAATPAPPAAPTTPVAPAADAPAVGTPPTTTPAAAVPPSTLEDCTGSLTKPADETKCDQATAAQKAAAASEKTAADAAAVEDSACKSASKDQFGEEMSCAVFNQKLESICIAGGYKSCAEKAVAEKNLRGTGFKLNLNALTLTSGGQKSGSAIFQNKDYAKYGVIVGTLMRIIDILIMLIGSLAMLTLVIAGIFMIANHGDEAWVTKGKTMMLYSILGILVALLSFAIVNVIQSALA